MSNTQQSVQQKAVAYWLPLYSFYADKATMSMTLADSEGNIQFKITPVLPGKEGRPQAGVQKYDYNNSVAITLNVSELSAILMSYNTGSINQTPASFYHKTQNGAITGGLAFFEGRFLFSINDQTRNLNHRYYFNFTKFGQQGSEVYVPSEVNLFINIIQGILSNLPLIKARLFPAYVPKNQTQSNVSQQSVHQSQFQQPTYQPQQQTNQPQQSVHQSQFQQPTNVGNGLPQSLTDNNISQEFNF